MSNTKTQKPTLRTVIEAPFSELQAPSGVFDETSGRELTNREVAEDFARKLGAQNTFLSSNGLLSPEAKAQNSEVTRSEHGEHILALVGVFPPEDS